MALPLLQQNRAKGASIFFGGGVRAGGRGGSQSCQHQHREPAGYLDTLVKHPVLSRLLAACSFGEVAWQESPSVAGSEPGLSRGAWVGVSRGCLETGLGGNWPGM